MGEALRILILEDEQTDAALEELELQEAGLTFKSKVVVDEKEYIQELHSFAPNLILSDFNLPQYNGTHALAEARRCCPDIPFILVTGAIGEDRAIEILAQGAKDYVLKSRINRLVPAVKRALAEAESNNARKKAEEALRDAQRVLEKQLEKRTSELRHEIEVRKQTEESLRKSAENLRLALEVSRQGTWDWNLIDDELIWSDGCRALFGINSDVIVNQDFFLHLVHPEDREKISLAFSESLDRNEEFDDEMKILWPDGTVHLISSKGRWLYNEEGKPVRMIGIARDITESRRFENDMQNSRKLEAVGMLAGGIAHDFNNLLAVIQGYIDLAKLVVSGSMLAYNYLEAAERAILQAAELTKHLITFAKGGEPIKQLVNIREIIKDTIDRPFEGAPLELSYFMDDDLWLAEVDEGQIRQVIRNLFLNALEAMPEGGSLKIRATNTTVNRLDLLPVSEGEYIRISFEDTGRGIPEKDLTYIFDPYFSTKQRGSQKGMGLGLSVCYAIMSKHNGCITVTSKEGEGSTFHIYVPGLTKNINKIDNHRGENVPPKKRTHR